MVEQHDEAQQLFSTSLGIYEESGDRRGIARVLEGTPTILIRHGDILEESLRREGISVDDLLRALREHGVDDPSAVRSAILEVDGTISVLRADELPIQTKPHHRIRGIRRRSG